MAALAEGLGQPPERMLQAFTPDPVQHLKLIRYLGRAPGESDQGVGAHKDSGIITLLLQNEQAGLQVQWHGRDDSAHAPEAAAWIDVPPRPGSLVVNLGKALELLTEGYLRATQHRVVSPASGVELDSVAFFLGPRLDAELHPLPTALAAQARGISRDPLNPLVAHAGRNFLKGRLRSHPEVAERFYADLNSR